jgi:hypothetical protein
MGNMKYSVTGANDAAHIAETLAPGSTPRVHTDEPEKLKFSLQWADISAIEAPDQNVSNNTSKDNNG